MDNEFILQDRIQKIQQIIGKYGEKNFYIAFSGGKDSTVMSALIDMALPDNRIPRVYADTGIELNMIKDFVKYKSSLDDRFLMIKPSNNIRKTLDEKGYPFKSKGHSAYLERYQRIGMATSVRQYLGLREDKEPWSTQNSCPQILRYQFSPDFKLNISDQCCIEMKEKPMLKWQEENNVPYSIVGIMREEGGRRQSATCLLVRGGSSEVFIRLQ